MEKVPSFHRFHVAKVEFAEGSEENGDSVEYEEPVVENGTVPADQQTIDSPSATFSLQNDHQNSYTAYGTHLKTFGKNTIEAMPHVDHYRNLLSATSAFKSRPTLAELHEEKDISGNGHRHREPLLSITESSPETTKTKETQSALKFGWIKGVLVRCLLNIWGVMLFLRLSWVVGQSGVGLGTAIVLLASVVTTLTSMSMSAICTNGEVKGGGAYYMISRSLGPEYGGAIGVIFSIANAVAVAMYVVGFAETVSDLMLAHGASMTSSSVNDVRIIGLITITMLLAIAIIGMEWEARAQVVLLGVLLIAIANFLIGTVIPPTEEKFSKGFTGYRGDVFVQNMGPNFRDGEGFFSVFAIFFPAATGILAGANISGDLKNPSKDIPRGTFLAIIISSISYIAVIWVLGAVLVSDATGEFASSVLSAVVGSPVNITTMMSTTVSMVMRNSTLETNNTYSRVPYSIENIQNCSLAVEGKCKYGLLNDYQAMKMVSGFGPLITAGIFSATLSSALASLVSAPKVFQALCKDRIFPKIHVFAKGYGPSDNPRAAFVLAYFIGVGFILIGDLNAIAPIISNFFLMAYTLINYSCFHSSLAKSPGWRPAFKYYSMWLSLVGALLCLAVMFVINWWTALITFAAITALYLYVHYAKPDVNWGSSTQAHVYKSVLQTSLKLVYVEDHIKNFRPQVLVLTGYPSCRPDLVHFVNTLTKKISLMVCGHIIETSKSADESKTLKEYKRFRRGPVYRWFSKQRIKAFYSVTTAPDFRHGVQSLLQNVGIGKLRPNILMMGFKTTWQTDAPSGMDAYFSVIHDAFDLECGVGVLRMSGRFYNEPTVSGEEPLVPQDDDENNYDAELEDSGSEVDSGDEDTPTKTHGRKDSVLDAGTPSKAATPSEPSKSINDLPLISANLFNLKQKGTIDVWWLFDDGGLTLLVPYILQTKNQWKQCGLRVFTAGTKRGQLDHEQRQMATLLSKFRIECQDIKIITDVGKSPTQKSKDEFKELIQEYILDEEKGETKEESPHKTTEDELLLLKEKTYRQIRLRELLQEHSHDASLIVMTLPMPRKGTCSSSLYMAWLETLTKDMPPILLLRGNQSSVLTFYS